MAGWYSRGLRVSKSSAWMWTAAIIGTAAMGADLPAPVEGYGRDDPAGTCARRLLELVAEKRDGRGWAVQRAGWARTMKPYRAVARPDYSFDTLTGRVLFDHRRCADCPAAPCVAACPHGVLELADGRPRLAIPAADARRGKCTECLACEIECYFDGNQGGQVILPIEGLEPKAESV